MKKEVLLVLFLLVLPLVFADTNCLLSDVGFTWQVNVTNDTTCINQNITLSGNLSIMGNLTLINTNITLQNNGSNGTFGIIINNTGFLNITGNSTITNNVTNDDARFFFIVDEGANLTMRNASVSRVGWDNETANGTGIEVYSNTLNISNSYITNSHYGLHLYTNANVSHMTFSNNVLDMMINHSLSSYLLNVSTSTSTVTVAKATISLVNSTIYELISNGTSLITDSTLTIYGANNVRSLINNATISFFYLYDNSSMNISNTSINFIDVRNQNNTLLFSGTSSITTLTMTTTGTSNITLLGNMSISNPIIQTNNTVSREYPFFIYNETGQSIAAANLSINSSTNNTIFNITLDANGYGVLNLSWNRANYQNVYNITIWNGTNYTVIGSISATSTTPINLMYDNNVPSITSANLLSDRYLGSGQVVNYTVEVGGEGNTTLASVTADGNSLSWDGAYWHGLGAISNTLYYNTSIGYITVIATDNGGNTDTYNDTNYTYDATNPVLNTTLIGNDTLFSGITMNSSNPWFVINWSIYDDNISYTRMLLDDTVIYTNTSSGLSGVNLSESVNTSIASGQHILKLETMDEANNSYSSTYALTINVPLDATNFTSNITSSDQNISNTSLFINGIDYSSNDTYINGTVNIIIKTNTTTAGFNTTINFSFTGTEANWNYTNFSIDIDNTSTLATTIESEINMNIDRMLVFETLNNFLANSSFGLSYIQFNEPTGGKNVFYVADEDGNTLYHLLQCSNNTAPSSISSESASCFTNNTQNTTVYLNHFSGAVLADDTQAPEVNFNAPLTNHSQYNDSFMTVMFNVTEPNNASNFCSWNITNSSGDNITQDYDYQSLQSPVSYYSSSDGINHAFSAGLTEFFSGDHVLHILCNDTGSRTTQFDINFSINDNSTPAISVTEYTPTTTTGRITWSANEYFNNFSLYYGTSSPGTSLANSSSNGSTNTSGSHHFTSLSAGTTYYYNLTVCDINNNCGYYADSFTTESSSNNDDNNDDGGGGGGGGGGGNTSGYTTQATILTKLISMITPGEEISFTLDSDAIAFERIRANAIGQGVNVLLKVTATDDNPVGTALTGKEIYQYVTATHENWGSEKIGETTIDFAVPVTWFTDVGVERSAIGLYRYENGEWRLYPAMQVTTTGTEVKYRSTITGLSTFAIAAIKAGNYGGNAPDALENPITGATTQQTGGSATSSDNVGSTTEDIEDPPSKGMSNTIIFIVVFVVIAGGIVAVIAFKLSKGKSELDQFVEKKMEKNLLESKDSVRKEQLLTKETKPGGEQKQPPQTIRIHIDELDQVKAYVDKERAKSIDDKTIHDVLINAGWSEETIHLVIDNMHPPHDQVEILENYVKNCMQRNLTERQIKEILLNVGWNYSTINLVFHEMHNPPANIEKIEHYVQDCVDKGISSDQIKEALLKVGWDASVVSDALSTVLEHKNSMDFDLGNF